MSTVMPFFVLPDAEAGDARDELFISIEGSVYSLSALQVVALIANCKVALRYCEQPNSMAVFDVERHLQDALRPFSNDPTDFIGTEACRVNNI